MSLKKKTVHSIFWSSFQHFGRQAFSFLFSIILARLLMPEDFGYVAMIMVFIHISLTLIESGLTQSLIREDDREDIQTDYSTVFFFNLGMSILLYLVLFFGAPKIAGFYDQPILHNLIRWQGLVIIIHALTSIQGTRLVKNLDFKTQFFAGTPSLIIAGGISVYLAYTGFGVYSIVVYILLDAMIKSALLWYFSDWKPSFVFDIKKFKHHFKFGAHLTMSEALETLFNELYTIIIGKFFSPAHLGYFTRAYSMQRMPVANLTVVLNKVTYPIFAKIKNNDLKLKEVYGKLLLMVVFTLTPILLYLGILGEPLFRFILTDKWLPAVPYFKILCLAGILYPLSSYNINLLKIKGKSDIILKIQLIKKFVFVLSLSFIFLWGMNGLLYGILFNAIFAFLMNSYHSGRLINFNTLAQIRLVTPLLIINLVAAVLVYWFSHQLLHLSDILQLLIGLSSGFVLYFILIFIFEKRILNIAREIIAAK